MDAVDAVYCNTVPEYMYSIKFILDPSDNPIYLLLKTIFYWREHRYRRYEKKKKRSLVLRVLERQLWWSSKTSMLGLGVSLAPWQMLFVLLVMIIPISPSVPLSCSPPIVEVLHCCCLSVNASSGEGCLLVRWYADACSSRHSLLCSPSHVLWSYSCDMFSLLHIKNLFCEKHYPVTVDDRCFEARFSSVLLQIIFIISSSFSFISIPLASYPSHSPPLYQHLPSGYPFPSSPPPASTRTLC